MIAAVPPAITAALEDAGPQGVVGAGMEGLVLDLGGDQVAKVWGHQGQG